MVRRAGNEPMYENKAITEHFVQGPGRTALGAGKPKFSNRAPQEISGKVSQAIGRHFKKG